MASSMFSRNPAVATTDMYGSVDAKSADSVVRADAGREIVSLTIADAVIVTLPLDEIDT
jgi:hypothetical protein